MVDRTERRSGEATPNDTYVRTPYRLIEICGIAGGCPSEQEARFTLLDMNIDPDQEIKPTLTDDEVESRISQEEQKVSNGPTPT